jgi:hypothetical protein
MIPPVPSIKRLVHQLETGGLDAVNAAWRLHNYATQTKSKTARIQMINAGSIPHLVTMIGEHGEHAVASHEAAVRLLRRLSSVDSVTRLAIIDAGAVPHVVNLLQLREQMKAQMACVIVLKRIAAEPAGTIAIAHADGVHALLSLLDEPSTNENAKLKALTMSVITNITSHSTNLTYDLKQIIARALVDLLIDPDAEVHKVQFGAIQGLFNLAAYNGNTSLLADAGIVDLLSIILFRNEAENVKMFAAMTLQYLVVNSGRDVNLIMQAGSYGVVDLLMAVLVGNIPEKIKVLAARTLDVLAERYGGKEDAVKNLVALLEKHGDRDPYAAVALVCQRLGHQGTNVSKFSMLQWTIWYTVRSTSLTHGDWYAKSPLGVIYRSYAKLLANYTFGPRRYARKLPFAYAPGGLTKRGRVQDNFDSALRRRRV